MSSGRAETYDLPRKRGEPDNVTEQKEKSTSPNVIRNLRNEFEQLFKSKTWRGAHNLPKGSSNRRALVVAINYGERRPPHRLYGTFVDALRIIRMLENFNYKATDICVLADIVMPDSPEDLESDSSDGDDSESRLPKKVNILKGLKWLASGTGDQQYRFLFFSGHGHHQPYNSSTSSQCIMPEDVKFQRLISCDNCVCSGNAWRASDQKGDPSLVPEPFSVLWDHVINQRLSGSLKPGTKFTAVFDCCHSGGMVENAFQSGEGQDLIASGQPNSKGRRQYGVADTGIAGPRMSFQEDATERTPLPSEDVIMTDPLLVEQTTSLGGTMDSTQSSLPVSNDSPPIPSMAGNFLGLPIEIDLITGTESVVSWPRGPDSIPARHEKTQNLTQASTDKLGAGTALYTTDIWAVWSRNQTATSPPAEGLQPSSDFTCNRPAGSIPSMSSFAEGCKIICWAACRRSESALEDHENAGRFTEAFTQFLTKPPITEDTQFPRSIGVLIDHLGTKFSDYNKEVDKNKWGDHLKQHPKLFVSTSVQSENYLQKEPDL